MRRYQEFIEDGFNMGRREDLTGGGLRRSAGGKELARYFDVGKGTLVLKHFVKARDRILSAAVCCEALEDGRRCSAIADLAFLAVQITKGEGIDEALLRSGTRKRLVARTRKLFSQIAVGKLGYSGAEVARFLGVTTSCVNRLAASEEVPEISGFSE